MACHRIPRGRASPTATGYRHGHPREGHPSLENCCIPVSRIHILQIFLLWVNPVGGLRSHGVWTTLPNILLHRPDSRQRRERVIPPTIRILDRACVSCPGHDYTDWASPRLWDCVSGRASEARDPRRAWLGETDGKFPPRSALRLETRRAPLVKAAQQTTAAVGPTRLRSHR